MVQAIEAWRTVIQYEPTFKDAHVNLGVALRATGQLNEAISHHRTALELDNCCIEACVNLGVALATRKVGGDCNAAATFYDRAIDLDPTYKAAHFNKGLLLVGEMDLDSAERCFKACIDLEPSDPHPHLQLAQLQLSINKQDWDLAYKQARAETPIAAQNPDKPKNTVQDHAYNRLLEQTTEKLFDKEESIVRLGLAMEGFLTVLQIDENCRDAHAGVGMVHLSQGDDELAEQIFEKVVERWPECITSHTQLAGIFDKSNRAKEAIPHWEFMLKSNDGDCDTRNKLGGACKHQGMIERALHHYRRALVINADYPWWFKTYLQRLG